jgi:hypothetical protein
MQVTCGNPIRTTVGPSGLGSEQPFTGLIAWNRWARLPSGATNHLHVDLLQLQTNQQPIEQIIVKSQSIRDLIGFDEDLIGFRSAFVRQMLKVLGEQAVVQVNAVQVEVREAIDDPGWNGRRRQAE